MVRRQERPEQGHALREMRHEGLESALEHTRNAMQQAAADGDKRLYRLYARQNGRIRREIVARMTQREQNDRDTEEPDHGTQPRHD